MTRLDAIRRRLEAATTPIEHRYAYNSLGEIHPAAAPYGWVAKHADERVIIEFHYHAPQDLRDLLELAEAAKAVKDWLHWPAVVGAFSLQAIHGGVPLEVSDKAQDILVRFEAILSRLDAEVEG